jgi:hypothetical protein
MKLEEFLKWWEQDNIRLVKHREVEKANHRWILFAVYSAEERLEYGRHFGLLVVVEKRTEEIVAHDMENQLDYNPSLGLESWFERHVREGLGNVT